MNSGAITAIGVGVLEPTRIGSCTSPVSGIGIATNVPILGGITNTGTITGSTASIDLTQEMGGSTVINQAGGALVGNVNLSANADVLDFSGGVIVNAVTAPSGNQDLVLITGQNATFALEIERLRGERLHGVAEWAAQFAGDANASAFDRRERDHARAARSTLALQGNLFAFAATPSVFKDVFVSGTPIRGAFANTTSTGGILFDVTLTLTP